MPKQVTPLNDTQIKNAKTRDKDYTLTDGDGLALLVKDNGSKLWRFRYTFDGQRYMTGFGAYPNVSLAAAREKRAVYQQDISNGINPTVKKREDKTAKKEEAKSRDNTFETALNQWLEVKRNKISGGTVDRIKRTFELYFLPFIGQKPIAEISKQEYIELILRMRDKGILYYAHKTKGMLQQFLNYLEEANIIENAITLRLENALPKPKETNFPHITDLKEFGGLLRALESYQEEYRSYACAACFCASGKYPVYGVVGD